MTRTKTTSQKWSPFRQKKLDRIVQVVGWLLGAASILCWFFDSVPPWVLIFLCSIPWVALAAVTFGGGKFKLLGPDDKTVINFVLMIPLGLMVGALLRFDVIDWGRGMVAACLGGALYLVGCYVAVRATTAHPIVTRPIPREPVRNLIMVFFVAMIGSGLSWATIVFVNALRETQPVSTLSGTVIAKSFSGGKAHSYYLHFSGQPTILGIDGFRVSKARYEHAHIGQAGCIVIHTGWLAIRYYVVTDC